MLWLNETCQKKANVNLEEESGLEIYKGKLWKAKYHHLVKFQNCDIEINLARFVIRMNVNFMDGPHYRRPVPPTVLQVWISKTNVQTKKTQKINTRNNQC